MGKLIIALLIPGSIILCLVAGKRLWVRAAAILLLLLGLVVIQHNVRYDRSGVALTLQTTYLTEFGRDTQALLDSGKDETAKLRLAEFNRRFPEVSGKPEQLSQFFAELKAITNRAPLEEKTDQRTNGSTVPTGARGRTPVVP